MLKRLFILLCLITLTGCRLPNLAPALSRPAALVTAAGQAIVLQGKVGGAYQAQATVAEIASGATVSLIDPASGATLGTTVTDPSGVFRLTFGPAFVPVDGQAFYLEAVKGIQGGNPQFNQAGADAVRLRTLVYYQSAPPAGWKSLTSATPGGVTISLDTTALSVALALKIQAGEPVSLWDYVGALAGPFATVGAVTDTDFNVLSTLVADALARDRDPLRFLTYDTVDRSFSSSFVGFAITDVAPRVGAINDAITITGHGFYTGTPLVAINGVPATLVGRTETSITARVNPGSRTGPVSVTIGSILQAGPTFTVRASDGHSAILNGKLYVANPSWGTLCEVAPTGEVKTVLTGLAGPTQVAVGPDGMLYLSCRIANKVVKVDPVGFAISDFASVPGAYGLCFDALGNLFVSSYKPSGTGMVVKLDAAGLQQATYTGFNLPTSMAFDFTGMLYVVEEAGSITQLTPTGADGAPRTPWATVPGPKGLAIDAAGTLHVASNATNALYRIDPARSASVWTTLNKPGGLCFDGDGNLYVSDTERNLVQHIDPQGNVRTMAYGIAQPRGLAIDPSDGKLYVSAYGSDAILEVNPADGVLRPFVTGLANPLTLNFRDDGLLVGQPDTNTVSFVSRQGQVRTVANALTQPGGADKDPSTGRIYVGRYGLPYSGSVMAGIGNVQGFTQTGFDTLDGATLTTTFPALRPGDRFLAVDGADTVYAVHQSTKRLAKYTYLGNNTYRTETLYTFASTPGMVAYDVVGNLYVPVPAENAVYRFDVGSGYARTVLTGFNQPWGLAFDDSGVLYVSNSGDGKLRRVSAPAAATAADLWTSVTVGTSVKGLAHLSGILYMADGTTIKTYTLADETVTTYLAGLPRSVSTLWVKPDLTMYAYADATFAYTVSPAKIVSTHTDMTGWSRLTAIAFDPAWRPYRAMDFDGLSGPYGASRLGYSHEVALDGDRFYIASPETFFQRGGVTRFDLGTGVQYQYRLNGVVYSLAVTTSRELFAGASDHKVYRVSPDTGASTVAFDLGTVPYGMDVLGSTLWAVGANNRVYELPIGGSVTPRYYGMQEPSF